MSVASISPSAAKKILCGGAILVAISAVALGLIAYQGSLISLCKGAYIAVNGALVGVGISLSIYSVAKLYFHNKQHTTTPVLHAKRNGVISQGVIGGDEQNLTGLAVSESFAPVGTAAAQAAEPLMSPREDEQLDVGILKTLLEKGMEESLSRIGGGKARMVYQVIGSQWLIKSAIRDLPPSRSQQDCLAYEISERLGFNVVPYTQYVIPGSKEADLFYTYCPTLRPVVLQTCIIGCSGGKFSVQEAHKVIFFNWIIGRNDTKAENSIVDINGKVWEVDNEVGEGQLKDDIAMSWPKLHWLLGKREVRQSNISLQLVDMVLGLPETIRLNDRLPDQFQLSLVKSTEQLVSENLNVLKTAILKLKARKAIITFESLKIEILPAIPGEE